MILLKTNLSVRNNSCCLRGTGVINKVALDCTFMGVMFLDSFLQQELRRASKDCSGRKYTNDYILYQIVTVGPLGPL